MNIALKIARNSFINRVSRFPKYLWLFSTLVSGSTALAQVQPDVMQLLKENDGPACLLSLNLFLMSFSNTVYSGLIPWEKVSLKIGTAYFSNGFCLLLQTNSYTNPPLYSTKGMPADYDRKGRLIVWREMNSAALFSSATSCVLRSIQVYFVDTNNHNLPGPERVVSSGCNIGDHNSVYLFDQFCLATGRGFSRYLNKALSEERDPANPALKQFAFDGSYGGMRGEWRLVCDITLGYLVRKATFTVSGQSQPTITVTNSGVFENDGYKIASSGTILYKHHEAEFQVIHLGRAVEIDSLAKSRYQQLAGAVK